MTPVSPQLIGFINGLAVGIFATTLVWIAVILYFEAKRRRIRTTRMRSF